MPTAVEAGFGGEQLLVARCRHAGRTHLWMRISRAEEVGPLGVPLCLLSSGEGGFGDARLVEGSVAEHREQHVGSASGEGDECLVVALPLCDLAVVVGA